MINFHVKKLFSESVHIVEHGGRGCTHIEINFHVKNVCFIQFCLYYILALLTYFRHRFIQVWKTIIFSLHFHERMFFQQIDIIKIWLSGSLLVQYYPTQWYQSFWFSNFGFSKFRLLFACVKDGKYGHDDKFEWC